MSEFTDCMVDIETTGTMPDRSAILQIAAVKFNISTGAVSDDVFDRCLTMPNWRFWQEDTKQWWGQQKRSVIENIFQRAERYNEVMDDFCLWASPPTSMRFWSKPSHFDFNFISSYCSDTGNVNPFDFRQTMDLNSFLRGIYAPNPIPDLDIEFKGNKHNALHDTLHQIKVLYTHMENTNSW